MSVDESKNNQSTIDSLISTDFIRTLLATVVGTVLGSNTGQLSGFVGISEAGITILSIIIAVPLAIVIHLFYQWMASRKERKIRERELSKIPTHQDPTAVPISSSGDEILITGLVRFSGVIIQAHLFDSGEIVIENDLCPCCQSVLYHPESPTPAEIGLNSVNDFDIPNHSNTNAIKQASKKGKRLWVLKCSSESCEYERYASYTDLREEDYRIKSLFKKHFDRIKNDPNITITSERPAFVWEKYAYTVDDGEVCSTGVNIPLADRILLRIR